MTEADASRRALLRSILKGAAAAFLVQHWAGVAVAAPVPSGPAVSDPDASTLELFVALSRLVTLRPGLDEALVKRLYPHFIEEPWGEHHIRSSYEQLVRLIGVSTRDAADIGSAKGGLGPGQTWFVDHLLTTWYLGVYYHERTEPVRVLHDEALVFEVVDPYVPRRFSGATGFGVWNAIPSGGSRE